MADIYPEGRWQVRITGHYPAKTVPKSAVKRSLTKGAFNPPKHEIDSFAKCILPATQTYFDTEAGRKEFAEWQARQQAENKTA